MAWAAAGRGLRRWKAALTRAIVKRRQAEASLRVAGEQLEQRVADRTADLAAAVRELRDTRMATLNMMEDAVEASKTLESANQALQVEIAERRRAEDTLQASEERFRGLVETTSEWIWEVDDQTRYTYVSPRVRELLGYEPEEVLGKTPFDLMPADEAQRVAPSFQQTVKQRGAIRLLENTNLHKDGHLVVLETSGVPFYDTEATFRGYRGIDRDITERREAEAAFRISESRYRALFDSNVIGIYVANTGGQIKDANDKFLQMVGYPRADLKLGKLGWDKLTPPDWKQADDHIKQQALTFGFCPATEKEFIHKYGNRIAVRVTVAMVDENEGDGITLVEDITQWKQREEELLRLATAVEQTADSIVVTATDGTIQYVNPAFERITGYSESEAIGQNPRVLKSGKTDPAVYEDLWRTITRGDIWTGQLTNKRRDGTFFDERVTISPVRDDFGHIVNYIAVKQDITAQNQLEAQFRQSQKLEAVGQLAGGVAHDFNNMLTAILGYSDLSIAKLNGADPIAHNLREIRKAAERAAALTRQLLAFSRKQILTPLVLDINSVVSDLEKMLRPLIGEDIDLKTILAKDLGMVRADPTQIEQVLMNLAVNARDAMPRGGNLTIETSNVTLDQAYIQTHGAVNAGEYVMLSVSDTGCGMDAETQAHIFEPFFTTKETGKGTGLGLSTIYGIVKQSGGFIWVYSEVDVGTTFKVYLPRVPEEGPSETVAVMEVTPIVGAGTVLLVEDNVEVRNLIAETLRAAGYEVLESGDGSEALSVAREHPDDLDLLITDVVMPSLGGRDLAEKLKALRPTTPAIFMSGYTDDAIVCNGIIDRDIDFLQKPFTPESLLRKVADVMQRREDQG